VETKTKKGILVRQSQYTLNSILYNVLVYGAILFAIVSISFLMAKYIVSYSIQSQMLNNKLWSMKTQELILNQKIHDVNAEINAIYFNKSSVIYIGDKAFSILKTSK